MAESTTTGRSPTQSIFRTRVARRVLLLFVLSALVPVAALSVISYRQVAGQLASQGRDRLQQAGKSTGMAILQRLLLLEVELKRNAVSVGSSGRASPETLTRTGGFARIYDRIWLDRDRAEPVPILGVPGPAPALGATERQRLANGQAILVVVADGSMSQVLMAVTARTSATHTATLWAEANPAFLWGGGDLQAATPPGMDLCVLDEDAVPLFCSLPVGPETAQALRVATPQRDLMSWEAGDGRELLVASWPIFLRFEFGRPDWTVLLAEAQASILAPAADFRRAFPSVVLLALLVVIFLSHSQIRRVLGPLQRLTTATRLVANRDFDRTVNVETGDEFQDLADSFNAMARQLGYQFRTLSAINDIDNAALSRSSSDQLVEVVLERVPSAAGADLVGLALRSTAADGMATWRITGRRLPSRRFTLSTPVDPDDENKLAWAADRLDDSDNRAPSFLSAIPDELCDGLRVAARTLSFETDQAGALIVGFKEDAEADEAMEIAQHVADQVSVALGNTQLVERLEQLSWGTLQALARSIDAMSSWTAGHSERVRDMAIAIGRELDLDEQALDCLHRAALLHDIGKLGVPSAILDKTGQLTDDEYEEVKRHVHIGARILAPIPSYADVIPIVLHHHEHYDGSGYPDGLTGEEIPLLARILSVADCYDALSSERPYRTGSHAQALSIVQLETGTAFDPGVAAAFLRVVEARGLKAAS